MIMRYTIISKQIQKTQQRSHNKGNRLLVIYEWSIIKAPANKKK